MASIAFDFIDTLNINYSMLSRAIECNLGTYTSKLPTFLGWRYASLITQMLSKIYFCIYLKSILWVHHIEAIPHPMSRGSKNDCVPLLEH